MMAKLTPPKTHWLHVKKKKAEAIHFKVRLGRVLHALPENHLAILRYEGLALYCELTGNLEEAISQRKREIELMQRLHGDVQSPKYSEKTKEYMMRDRDDFALKERFAILESLARAVERRTKKHAV
jgi:hypothetical protein